METQFFPSRTVAFYMVRLFLMRTLAFLFALVLILQTLDLLGETGNILAQPGNGNAEIWRYVGLRVPQLIARFLPFAVLLGTLITLATLNQNSEVVSMKAAGLSAHQVLAPLVIASLAIAAVSFTFNERVVARSNAALDQWQKLDYGPAPPDRGVKLNIWTREGDDLIRAGLVRPRGDATLLSNVTIYRREQGVLQSVITAPTARRADGRWLLQDASLFDVSSSTSRKLGPLAFGRQLSPEQFTLADVDPDGLSITQLGEAITQLKAAGRPYRALEANWWHKIAGPLSSALMPLLGAVAAFGIARSGKLFVRAVIGMALGFAYFVADNFGLAMGNLGAYPPLLAAWGPFVLFLLIGETVLIRTEE